uniref:non-specific serine/threonine protein kinase n=1 Tax=Macrostomum lignano TaxID=282301 RepID=A0A1I8F5S8_9PLAT
EQAQPFTSRLRSFEGLVDEAAAHQWRMAILTAMDSRRANYSFQRTMLSRMPMRGEIIIICEEVIEAANKSLHQFDASFWESGFNKLIECYQKCIFINLHYERQGALVLCAHLLSSGRAVVMDTEALGNFSIECARFYCGELLEACCEYLNSIGIVHHRDDFQLKLGDFGSAFITGFPKCPSYTATPHYAAPEMLLQTAKGDHTVLYTMDLWAIGCCLFQFLSGRPPFRGRGTTTALTPVAKDLVTNLLVKEAADRLGSPSRGGFDAVEVARILYRPAVRSADQEVDWANVPLGYSQGVRQLPQCRADGHKGSSRSDCRLGSGGAPIDAQNKASETERLRRGTGDAESVSSVLQGSSLIIRHRRLSVIKSRKRRGSLVRPQAHVRCPHLRAAPVLSWTPEKMELKGEVPGRGPGSLQFERRTGKAVLHPRVGEQDLLPGGSCLKQSRRLDRGTAAGFSE